MKSLGRIPRSMLFKEATNNSFILEKKLDQHRNLTRKHWLSVYNLVRKSIDEHLDEMFYSSKREFPIGKKLNILEGIDPMFGYKAFHAWLIENLYP